MSSFPRAARRTVVLLAALVLAGTGVAVPSPSGATAPSTTGVAAAAPHGVPVVSGQLLRAAPVLRRKATIRFEKNVDGSPFRSRVVWRSWKRSGAGSPWKLTEEAAWRAGSGTGPRAKDSCAKGEGWLPNGVYSFVQHDRRDGTYIDGRVFELAAKPCRDGTLREMLFIHSEQTVDNGQCADLPGDQRCRWEVPRWNDYRSAGCIKMAPGDLAALTRRFHRYYAADVRYPTDQVRVRVLG
ncbi:hypothetical protein SAMN04488570_3264 [Nocardioides scoriae]|uniref:L,D-transpeptidase catalytic domain n=1 Tax=Nocardioides scoriae TaxID=642780 RepID=A0A1H1WV83_9ACTN|nr:hypothetical protein [Nocardioides scoriae]SDT00286.1 hypothetical protein SAMN04488570_3264 [Nocardioides scoriae]